MSGMKMKYFLKKEILFFVFTFMLLLFFIKIDFLLKVFRNDNIILALPIKNHTATCFKPCHQEENFPLSIVGNAGRLGNQMFTYATLYGIARFNHRRALGPSCNIKKLKKYFHISMEAASNLSYNSSTQREAFTVSVRNLVVPPNNHLIQVRGVYPISYVHFQHVLKDVIKEFRFKDFLLEYADSVLRVAQGNKSDVTFVGVHVRRGDYHEHLCRLKCKTEASPTFYRNAIDFFRRKFSNVIFLVVSDTPEWAKEYMKADDVRFVGDKNRDAAFDLSVLARCNHTIFAYGTFGTWAAILAGGLTVHLADFFKVNPQILRNELTEKDMYLPNWIGIVGSRPLNCSNVT